MRTARYSGFRATQLMASTHFNIIGCGAIGSVIARILAQMGNHSITLQDADTVSSENLGPQGFFPSSIGQPKVIALQHQLTLINPEGQYFAINRFLDGPGAALLEGISFVCVDSVDTRREFAPHIPRPFFDVRMAAQAIRVYSVFEDTTDYDHRCFFPSSERVQEPCAMRSTAHSAYFAAATAVTCLFNALNDNRPPTCVDAFLPGLCLSPAPPEC